MTIPERPAKISLKYDIIIFRLERKIKILIYKHFLNLIQIKILLFTFYRLYHDIKRFK